MTVVDVLCDNDGRLVQWF